MFDLNKKVAPQENLVGWFATGGFLIHLHSVTPFCHDLELIIVGILLKLNNFEEDLNEIRNIYLIFEYPDEYGMVRPFEYGIISGVSPLHTSLTRLFNHVMSKIVNSS
jgi:hypothetical protein